MVKTLTASDDRLSKGKFWLTVFAVFAGVIGLCAPAIAFDGVVKLAPSSVAASGIVVTSLASTQYTPQVEGIASILDPQPLLAASAQLVASKAAADSAKEQALAAVAEAKRLEALYQNDKLVSQRDEEVAVAAAAAAKAQQSTAIANDGSARASARANWGAALATLAEGGPHALADYADGRRALLAVALPLGTVGSPANKIHLRLPNGADLPAILLGPSPQADTVVQGLTYFYRAPGGRLRSGQRYTALVPIGTNSSAGIIVPDAAVLWYAGEPWVYIESGTGVFERHVLAMTARDPRGWFQEKGFHAGERVVVQGGELLLTQELKPPVSVDSKSGDEDDD